MASIGTSWNSPKGIRTFVGVVPLLGGETMLGIRTGDSRIFQLFHTEAEIDQEIRRDTVSVEVDARIKAEKEVAAATYANQRANLDRFITQFPRLAGAKANAALTKKVMWSGVYIPRHEHVEQRVAQGWHVETTPKGERRFYGPDGRFLTEKDTSKVALDYAEFLRAGTRAGGKRRHAAPSLAAAEKALRKALRK
jgi:hypothetical protein